MGDTSIIDPYNLTLSYLISLVMQLTGLVIACITDRGDYFFDLFGALNFIGVTLLTLALGGISTTSLSGEFGGLRPLYLSVCVCISRGWLGAYLQYRVCSRGSDTRVGGKDKNPSFLAITWVLQSLWVFLNLVPVLLVNAGSDDLVTVPGTFGVCTIWDVAGIFLICFGFVLQVSADMLKSRFRSNPANNNEICKVCVWSCSRHPNFLGEILFWWGVWVSSVPVLWQLGGWSLLSLCSPLFTMVLLIFVSGLPFAEGKFLKRFYDKGQGEAWEEYCDSTPPLCLVPFGLYAYVPETLKCLCCCEFPFLKYDDGSGVSSGSSGSEASSTSEVQPEA